MKPSKWNIYTPRSRKENCVTPFVFISCLGVSGQIANVCTASFKTGLLQYRWAAWTLTSGKFVPQLWHSRFVLHSRQWWDAPTKHWMHINAKQKGLIWSHLRGFILATQIERIGASLEEVPVCSVHRQFWGNWRHVVVNNEVRHWQQIHLASSLQQL